MNDLISEVTPLTRAVVWLRSEQNLSKCDHFQGIDYLLNGLLTATLNSSKEPSILLVGSNFHQKLYVFTTNHDPSRAELDSFFSLLEKDMGPEDRILVVDDANGRENFLRHVPQKILSHFHLFQ